MPPLLNSLKTNTTSHKINHKPHLSRKRSPRVSEGLLLLGDLSLTTTTTLFLMRAKALITMNLLLVIPNLNRSTTMTNTPLDSEEALGPRVAETEDLRQTPTSLIIIPQAAVGC